MSITDKIIWHLASSSGTGPRCGRQLSRPALTTANQASMRLTTDLAEVRCRHCLRAVGLLAPVAHKSQGITAEEVMDLEPFYNDEDEEKLA